MSSQRLKLVVSSLFILWLFLVLASFFAVQKPFSAVAALAMGRVLLDLAAAGWLALIALAAGSWLLERLLGRVLSLVETVVLGTGLGLGMISLLHLALGLAALFRPAVTYGLTIALTVLFAPQLGRLFKRCPAWRWDNLPAWPILLYLLLLALLTLSVALLPPTDFDGLLYHLAGPKLYLQAGGIVGGIDNFPMSFPMLMEMLYAWVMLLRGDIAAKLLHPLFVLLTGSLVYLTTARLLSQKAAWRAVLIFASMPMVFTLAGWAYNDFGLAFYQLAGVYSIINYQCSMFNVQCSIDQTPTVDEGLLPQNVSNIHEASRYPAIRYSSLSWLILGGIFTGLALGVKYTSLVMPVVLSLIILWQAIRCSRLKAGVKALALFLLVALLIALPWYFKNWLVIGNPVYPFLFDWFGGDFWDTFRANWYAAAGSGIGWQPAKLLTLPWLVTLGVHDVNYWDGRLGPLFLLFLPLILLCALWRECLRNDTRQSSMTFYALLAYAVLQFGFWTMGVIWSHSLWQSRQLLPGLVILTPLVGWVWANLSRFDLPQFSISRFTNVAIGLVLALTLVETGLSTIRLNPLAYLTGLQSRDEYLTRRLTSYYAVMQQINQNLPPETVVLFMWEARPYYCERDCRPDSVLDVFAHAVYLHHSAPAIAAAWREAGVTHVLVHTAGLNFVLNEVNEAPATVNPAILAELEANELVFLFEVGGAYKLYALEPAP